jgi:hypothetical protein
LNRRTRCAQWLNKSEWNNEYETRESKLNRIEIDDGIWTMIQ